MRAALIAASVVVAVVAALLAVQPPCGGDCGVADRGFVAR